MRIRQHWPLIAAALVVAVLVGVALLARAGAPPGETTPATRDPRVPVPDAGSLPAPPADLTATAGNSSVTLTWTNPGDASITGYEYQQRAEPPGPGWSEWRSIPSRGWITRKFTASGLTNGTEYRFRLRARNAYGVSEPVPGWWPWHVAATPAPPPAAPSGITATASNSSVTLAWTHPLDPSIVRYEYQQRRMSPPGGWSVWMPAADTATSDASFVVERLINGAEYRFRLRAVNAIGASSPGPAEEPRYVAATPDRPPGFTPVPAAPLRVGASAGDGYVNLGWVNPDDPWIRHYEYQLRPALPERGWTGWMRVPDSGPSTFWFTVSGLMNGTEYRFRVRAVHRSGGASPAGPLGPPGFVTATPMPPPTPPPAPVPTPAPRPCVDGAVVPNPDANPELVADCELLLAMRDGLAGTGSLDWNERAAINDWKGVTVGGSPQRVERLELARSGLTGRVSGLIGDLTALTHLRLNGNRLTGRLPSSVARLTNLTHLYLDGNAFTGCLPPSLRTVANSDAVKLELADCPDPVDISFGDPVLTPGTYVFIWDPDDPALFFDVPDGLRMRVKYLAMGDQAEEGPPFRGLILQESTGRHRIGLDVGEGEEYFRASVPGDGERPVPFNGPPTLSALFDRLGESAWIGWARGQIARWRIRRRAPAAGESAGGHHRQRTSSTPASTTSTPATRNSVARWGSLPNAPMWSITSAPPSVPAVTALNSSATPSFGASAAPPVMNAAPNSPTTAR